MAFVSVGPDDLICSDDRFADPRLWKQFVTLISGDDPPHEVPAKAAIGALTIDGLTVSTAEGTHSVFLSYSSSGDDGDEPKGKHEKEECRT